MAERAGLSAEKAAKAVRFLLFSAATPHFAAGIYAMLPPSSSPRQPDFVSVTDVFPIVGADRTGHGRPRNMRTGGGIIFVPKRLLNCK